MAQDYIGSWLYEDYVRKNETKIVRKNVSIPSYLNELAKKEI